MNDVARGGRKPRRWGPALVAGNQESEAEVETASEASSAELCAVCLEDVRGMAAALPWPVLPPRLRAHWLAAHRACPAAERPCRRRFRTRLSSFIKFEGFFRNLYERDLDRGLI